MPKILYLQPVHPCGMRRLAAREDFRVEVAPSLDWEALSACVADADAIVTRLTNVDARLMALAPRLKAVAKHGVGVDNIDTAYCAARGIRVLTTGDANSSSVAEHAMLAIGALFKRMPWLDARMREGDWGARDRAGGQDLAGRTLGLIGCGRIGQRLARMARFGFQMNVCAYDPYADRAMAGDGLSFYDDLDDMLPLADVVSLHVPLTPQTRGMLDARRLARMKRGAFLINFSRGGTVCEDALARAIMAGQLAGAALDVFEEEPPRADNPLLHMENVLLSPHCATFTEDSRKRMSMRLAEEIERALDGAAQDNIGKKE